MYYNFCRIHQSLRVTPAIRAKVTGRSSPSSRSLCQSPTGLPCRGNRKRPELFVSSFMNGQPVYPRGEYRDFAQGGYSKNSIVYSCINEIATSFNESQLEVVDTDNSPIPNHPLIQLLIRLNPFMSKFEFLEFHVLYLLLTGNAYWEKVRSVAGRVSGQFRWDMYIFGNLPGGKIFSRVLW